MATDQSIQSTSSGQIVRRVDDAHLAAALAPRSSSIVARMSINIRPATLADVAVIDSMQKKHTRELGFLPTKALEGKIALNEVLIAEEGTTDCADFTDSGIKSVSSVSSVAKKSLGYLIAADRYFKRDEVGYITQINVLPEYRRSLVAAALLQAQFDRSAYGCRLYCCWCAQDLVHANEFWEAMGFTAIAFRTGSRTRGQSSEVRGQKKPRTHIFWQKRVRADDATTSWWYPAHTGGGELREDRLVFPIPPRVGWRDVLPALLPDEASHEGTKGTKGSRSDEQVKKPRTKKVIKSPRLKGGLWFAHEGIVERVEPDATQIEKAAATTIDPRLKKLARELRDVWTERQAPLILPSPAKHDVRRIVGDVGTAPALATLPKAA